MVSAFVLLIANVNPLEAYGQMFWYLGVGVGLVLPLLFGSLAVLRGSFGLIQGPGEARYRNVRYLARDPRLAPKGAVFGTPEYMSPEQARGDDAVPSSDLYALGILFFEMTTGQLPFRSSDRDTLLEMQRSSPPPRPSSVRKDIPEDAEKIILQLLEKDPRRRFRDGHHLSEQLKALQRKLAARGHDVGAIDGILGAGTRAAVQAEQERLGLPADAWPTTTLLNRL